MAILFDIDHEAGNLSEYTSTVEDSGDLSAHADAALAGTNYGLKCFVDDTNAIYGDKNFTWSTSVFRYRVYFDPNSLAMADGDEFIIVRLLASGSQRGAIYFKYTIAAGYQIKCRWDKDVGLNWSGWLDITDDVHYFEHEITYASSDVASDATHKFWIDSVIKWDTSGLDIYDLSKANEIWIGATTGLDAGTSGEFYLDQLKANDDGSEIGAHSPPAAGISIFRRRRTG